MRRPDSRDPWVPEETVIAPGLELTSCYSSLSLLIAPTRASLTRTPRERGDGLLAPPLSCLRSPPLGPALRG